MRGKGWTSKVEVKSGDFVGIPPEGIMWQLGDCCFLLGRRLYCFLRFLYQSEIKSDPPTASATEKRRG